MATHSADPVSSLSFTKSKFLSIVRSALIMAGVLLLLSPLWNQAAVYSQSTGAVIRVASGYPTELPADNKSETVLEVDYDNCSFGVPTDSSGTYSLSVNTSKGQIDPPFSSSMGGGAFPPVLTLKAGSSPGEAIIDVIVSYCPADAVVLMGVCSDQAYMDAECTGSTTFLFVEPDAGEDNQDQPSSAPTQSDQQPQSSSPSEPKSSETTEQPEGTSLAELYDDLETFLAGEGITAPTPGQMTASGIAITTLLAGWIVLNQMAGTSVDKSFEVIKAWKDGERPPIGAEAKLPVDFVDGDVGAEGDIPGKPLEPADPDETLITKRSLIQEGGEDRVLRGVKDAQDMDDALKKTNKDIETFEGKIPDQIKESEVWKDIIAPKLKKIKSFLKKGELDKTRTWLDRGEELLNLRKEVERDLDYLPADSREAILWTERTLKVLGHFASDAYYVSVVAPAKAVGEKFLPGEYSQKFSSAMDELGQGISDLGQDLAKMPRTALAGLTHANLRKSAPKLWRELYGSRELKNGFDFSKSPKNLKRILNEAYDNLFNK